MNKLGQLTTIVNTAYNLDWYDVCIENNAYITRNGDRIQQNESNTADGLMRLTIYPLSKNVEDNRLKDWVKEQNHGTDEGKFYEHRRELLAKPNSTRCLPLSAKERGFYFSNPSLNIFNHSLAFEINDEDRGVHELIIGEGHYRAINNSSKLIVKTSLLAFIVKGIIYWLLLDGILLLIMQVIREIPLGVEKNN